MTAMPRTARQPRLLVLRTLGCDVHLEITGSRADEAFDEIRSAWEWTVTDPSAAVDTEPITIRIMLDDDATVLQRFAAEGALATSTLATLMHWLSQAITRACIDRQAGKLLMIHACALGDLSNGRALAAVAPSGTGKTTLVRTLGQGRVYLSDETVGLGEGNLVVPHAKPLSVATTLGDGFKSQHPPATFSMQPPSKGLRLADIWFLNRVADPVAPRLERMSVLDAIATIAPQISYLAATPDALQRLASTIEAVGGLKLATYHDAADLEPLVVRALAGFAEEVSG